MHAQSIETTRAMVETGIGRRAALTGIVGALVGWTALGAGGAAAKNEFGKGKRGAKSAGKGTDAGAKVVNPAAKKKSGQGSGGLLRVEHKQTTTRVEANDFAEVFATCPTPRNTETLQVLGGGFGVNDQEIRVLSSLANADKERWEVTVKNGKDVANVQAQAVCGYFRK